MACASEGSNNMHPLIERINRKDQPRSRCALDRPGPDRPRPKMPLIRLKCALALEIALKFRAHNGQACTRNDMNKGDFERMPRPGNRFEWDLSR